VKLKFAQIFLEAYILSHYLNMKKNTDFFCPSITDTSDHGTKSDPTRTFELPGKDFTPWVYALYRVNKRVLTRKIGHFRVTLREITRNVSCDIV
jgi:hypothetical protein